MKALLLISSSLKTVQQLISFVHCKIHGFETMKLVIHPLNGMNITTTLVVLQCQLAQELHGQLSTCIYSVFRFIVSIYVRHEFVLHG